VANFVNSFVEYSFLSPLVQNYKNRLRKARVKSKTKWQWHVSMAHGVDYKFIQL